MKNKKIFLVVLLVIIGLGCLEKEETTVNHTNVTIEGSKILVNNQPFIIKGIGYAPVPIGSSKGKDYYTTKYADLYNRDLPIIRSMNANTIRLWGWDNTADHTDFLNRMYNNGKDPIYLIASFWIGPDEDISSPEVRNKLKADFRQMVAKHKNHPAILMWAVGNELNAKWRYDKNKMDDLFSLINELAKEAHLEEGINYHPVTTTLVDANITETIETYDSNMTYLDVWSAQLYRGKDFGSFFKEYANVSSKPAAILEFGIDAYDDKNHKEYEDVQAEYLSSLWRHLEGYPDIAIGGSIMTYSDGWYKGNIGRGKDGCPEYNASFHSECGYAISSHPDGYANVEYWGVVRVKDNGKAPDIVEPRQAYYTLQKLWANETTK